MPLICDQCGTDNRPRAKFCRGCARPLPDFVPTGRSALELMKALPVHAPAGGQSAQPGTHPHAAAMLPLESRRFWWRAVLLAAAFTALFVGWYSWVTRPVPTRPSPDASAPAARAPAPLAERPRPVPAATAPPRAGALPATVDPVPGGAGLQPPPAARATPESEILNEDAHGRPLPRPLSPGVPAAGPPQAMAREGAADPRTACAALGFFARHRCEAAQCERAAFRQHAYCDGVRAQRARDEARRNLNF